MIGRTQTRRRRVVATWAVLVLASVLVRVGMAMTWPQHIAGTDAEQYLILADNLAKGLPYSLESAAPHEPDVFRSPGYPLLLAFLLTLGMDLVDVLAVQVALDVFSLTLGARLLARLVGTRAALAGFALAALSPFTAAVPCLLLSESLAMPLITLVYASVLDWRRPSSPVCTGLLVGMLALTRGIFVLAIPIAAVFAVVAYYRSARPGSCHNLARGLQAGLAITFFAGVVILPYGAWNLAHHGRFSVTPLAGGGRALAGGLGVMQRSLPGVTEEDWIYYERLWNPRGPRPAVERIIEIDRRMWNAGVDSVRGDIGAYARGVARAAIHIWFGVRFLFPFSNPDIPPWLLRSGSLAILMGAACALWRLRTHWFLLVASLTPVITLAIAMPFFYVSMRYTTLAFGPLQLLAGVALFHGLAALCNRARSPRRMDAPA